MKRILALLLLLSASLVAAEKSLHWSDVRGAVGGKNVSVTLSDGSRVRGSAVSVEPDSLVVSTGGNARQTISRSSIREIRVRRRAGYKWRTIGTAIGAGIGIAAAAPVLAETHNEGSSNLDGAAAGLIAGLAIVGFFLGWSSDRATDTIRVIPD